MLARFQSYQSGSAPEIDAAVRQAMQRFLEAAGYRVVRSGSLTLQGALEEARGSGADFVLSGYYRRGQINLELFGQI